MFFPIARPHGIYTFLKRLARMLLGCLVFICVLIFVLFTGLILTNHFGGDENGYDPGVDVCRNLSSEQIEAFRWKGNADGLFHVKSSNPDLVYEMRPKSRLNDYIATNSDGFRDREFSKAKQDRVSRICVVGDSIAFGWWEKVEETFSVQVEQLLNQSGKVGAFEVYNMAVGGYNAAQEAALIEAKVLPFHPDLIILQFCDNDNLTGCDAGLWWHFMKTGNSVKDYLLRRQYFVIDFLNGVFGNGVIEHSYRRIRDICRTAGVPVLLVPFPNRIPENANRQVKPLGEALGFHVLDLAAQLSNDERSVFFSDDWHPTKMGHAIAARKIVAYIIEHWNEMRSAR